MSVGVGIEQWEKTVRSLYPASSGYATRGAVGPGPSQNANRGVNELGSTFHSATGVVAGTGWTYDAGTKRYRLAATPGADTDLTVTISTVLSGVKCRYRIGIDSPLKAALTLRTAAALIATIPVGFQGIYEVTYTLLANVSSIVIRSASGVAQVAEVSSMYVIPGVFAQDDWKAANTGLMSA